jgi:hypothetical protein
LLATAKPPEIVEVEVVLLAAKVSKAARPETDKSAYGEVVPMPTLPVFVTRNKVEVAPLFVEDEMRKIFRLVSKPLAEIASLAQGEDVPTPSAPSNVDEAVVDVAVK